VIYAIIKNLMESFQPANCIVLK